MGTTCHVADASAVEIAKTESASAAVERVSELEMQLNEATAAGSRASKRVAALESELKQRSTVQKARRQTSAATTLVQLHQSVKASRLAAHGKAGSTSTANLVLGRHGDAVLTVLDATAAMLVHPEPHSQAPVAGLAVAEAEYEAAQEQLRGRGAHHIPAESTTLLQARDSSRDSLTDCVAAVADTLARGSDRRAAQLAACEDHADLITRFLASHPDDEDGCTDPCPDISAAILSFRVWLAENDGDALAARTETAASTFQREAPQTVALFFTDQSTEAVGQFDVLWKAAHDAFVAEQTFWSQRTERIAAAPVATVVAAAQSAAAALTQIAIGLRAEDKEQRRLAQQLQLLKKLKDVNIEDIKKSFLATSRTVRKARRKVELAAVDAKYAAKEHADGEIDGEEFAEARDQLSSARGMLRSAQEALRRSLLRVIDRSKHFPELMELFEASVGVLVPQTLLPIWNPEHTLSCYSEYEEMGAGAAGGRPGHAIFKARLGNRSVVVKQYTIDKHTAAKNLKAFFNEVSILCKLKSPYVAQVEQLFVDRHHIFVQMPHYSLGNLLQWASAEMAPPLDVARRCLHQVAVGLHHLHHLKIVHCDIKPEVRGAAEGMCAQIRLDQCACIPAALSTVLQPSHRFPPPHAPSMYCMPCARPPSPLECVHRRRRPTAHRRL